MSWRRSFAALLLCWLAACANRPAPEPDPGISPWSWEDLAEQGLSVAPVAGVHVMAGSTDAPSEFSRELYFALKSVFPRSPVVAADEVYGRMESAGPAAHARLRSLRRRLVRELPLDPDEIANLQRDLGQRFVLVAFMHEGTRDELHRTTLDDFDAFEYSMDVHSYPTGELHGVAIGFLIDLEEGVAMWRGDVEYHTEGLPTAGTASRRLIEHTRSDAAFRLAEELDQVSSGRRL